MQDIDFLPRRYHERHALRRVRLIQLGALSLMLLGIAATVAGQLVLRRSLQHQLRAIQGQHALATSRHARLRDLERQWKAAQEIAELYAYLGHPWPRTQLLMQLVTPLPPSIAVTELTIAVEGQSRPAPAAGPILLNAGSEDDQLPPALHDLRDLRKRYDALLCVADVKGRARDPSELHAFVARLAKQSLFQTAKIDSLETHPDSGVAVFQLRLVVKPGYGRPGGPSVAAAKAPERLAQGARP